MKMEWFELASRSVVVLDQVNSFREESALQWGPVVGTTLRVVSSEAMAAIKPVKLAFHFEEVDRLLKANLTNAFHQSGNFCFINRCLMWTIDFRKLDYCLLHSECA